MNKKIVLFALVFIAACCVAYAANIDFDTPTQCMGPCGSGTEWGSFTLTQTTKTPTAKAAVTVQDEALSQETAAMGAAPASTECGPFNVNVLCAQKQEFEASQGVEITSTQSYDYAIGQWTAINDSQIVRDPASKTGFQITHGARAGTRDIIISCLDETGKQYGETGLRDSVGLNTLARTSVLKCADYADPNGNFWCAGVAIKDPATSPVEVWQILEITADGATCAVTSELYFEQSTSFILPSTTEIKAVALVDGDNSGVHPDLAIVAVDEGYVNTSARLAIYSINDISMHEYVVSNAAGGDLALYDVANQPATSPNTVVAVGNAILAGISAGLEMTVDPDTPSSDTANTWGIFGAAGDGVWFDVILKTGPNTIYGGLNDLTGIQPAKPFIYSSTLSQYTVWDNIDDPIAGSEISGPYSGHLGSWHTPEIPDEELFETCITPTGTTYGVQCNAVSLICGATGIYSADTIVAGSILDMTGTTYGQESKVLVSVLQPAIPDGTMTVALWSQSTDIFSDAVINTAWSYDAGADGGPLDISAIVTQYRNDVPGDHRTLVQVITAFDPPNATGWGTNNVSFSSIAINPNGTTRFTTDKYVSIETMNPDINILNFRLGWQNFSGTFDTSAGTCSGCTFDLDNGTCQAEVEKIFGMFVTYNLTINLTPDRTLNFTALNLLCRDGNETVTAHSGCLGLFSAYPNGITSTGCMQWINSTYATTFSNGLAIDLHNLTTSIEFNMGTLTPTPTCEMIACELNGTWEPGDTQEFTINKTITVIAN